MENTANREVIDTNMGTDMNSRQSKPLEYITTLVHIFIVAYVIFMVYLCLSNEFVFFTWHPLLLSIGWILLMGEGILIFNENNVFIKRLGLTHKAKVTAHWCIQSAAITSSVIAYVIVYISKDMHGKQHLHTWHGICGFSSIVSCVPVVLSGLIALYNIKFKNYISPVNSKLVHRVFGLVTYTIGFATILLSLYTHWFQRKVNDIVTILWFVLLSLTIVWCMTSASYKVFNRLKKMI